MAKSHRSRKVTTSQHRTTSTPKNTTMPQKRSAHHADIENRIQKAIESLKSGEVKGPFAAAKLYGLHLRTLTCRLNGGLSHAQSREEVQLLSKTEEDALALWCKRITAGGHPAPHR